MSQSFIAHMSCINRPGIVAALGNALFQGGFDIQDSQQFDDPDTDRYFVRIAFQRQEATSEEDVRAILAPVRATFGMELSVHDAGKKQRVLLLASKFDHCLADLLYRWRTGELEMDVAGIVSNHGRETYSHLDFGEIPFFHLPVTRDTKPRQEAEILRIVEHGSVDLVVLARYMQILSDDMARSLSGRCINIHHSFLPGFKGAKPYHQAFDRGVKIIGATAHYVTADLDEGPIIEQDVERITHRDGPEQLIRKGRDIERRVLSRAVRFHLEGRVILNGAKTIVFAD